MLRKLYINTIYFKKSSTDKKLEWVTNAQYKSDIVVWNTVVQIKIDKVNKVTQ